MVIIKLEIISNLMRYDCHELKIISNIYFGTINGEMWSWYIFKIILKSILAQPCLDELGPLMRYDCHELKIISNIYILAQKMVRCEVDIYLKLF